MRPGDHTLERVDDDQFVLTWIGKYPPWEEAEWLLTLDELAKFERGEGFIPTHEVVFRSLDEQIGRIRARQDQIQARLDDLNDEWHGLSFGEWNE